MTALDQQRTASPDDEIEQQSIKMILAKLCVHLDDIADQIAELNQNAEVMVQLFEKVTGEYESDERKGYVRMLDIER